MCPTAVMFVFDCGYPGTSLSLNTMGTYSLTTYSGAWFSAVVQPGYVLTLKDSAGGVLRVGGATMDWSCNNYMDDVFSAIVGTTPGKKCDRILSYDMQHYCALII
jgi:hypothetical protein